MLKQVLSNNRVFGAVVCALVFIAAGLLYVRSVKRDVARDVPPLRETAKPQQPPETSQGGHFHEDGTWHAEPHEANENPQSSEGPQTEPAEQRISHPSQLPARYQRTPKTPYPHPRDTTPGPTWGRGDWLPKSQFPNGVTPEMAYQALRAKHSPAEGNPHPFENVPVDLWDFQATKAAMIENINYILEHWDPKESKRDVRIADAIVANISNAADPLLGIFTSEQCKELREGRHRVLDFQGYDRGRVAELMDQGYSSKEALKIATDEVLRRQEAMK